MGVVRRPVPVRRSRARRGVQRFGSGCGSRAGEVERAYRLLNLLGWPIVLEGV